MKSSRIIDLNLVSRSKRCHYTKYSRFFFDTLIIIMRMGYIQFLVFVWMSNHKVSDFHTLHESSFDSSISWKFSSNDQRRVFSLLRVFMWVSKRFRKIGRKSFRIPRNTESCGLLNCKLLSKILLVIHSVILTSTDLRLTFVLFSSSRKNITILQNLTCSTRTNLNELTFS